MVRLNEAIPQSVSALASRPHLTAADRLKREIELYNDVAGDMNVTDGIECDICKNKGYIAIDENGYLSLKPCKCMGTRKNRLLIKKSGLAEMVALYTFDKFDAKAPWQKTILARAKSFLENFKRRWFFIGGQPGAGKTHIVTAIANELMAWGIEVRYMVWRDEIGKLKANMKSDDFQDMLDNFKLVSVLIIDDFFKSAGDPTDTDINIATEILNFRYNAKLTTIISSELGSRDLMSIDGALGSRIAEMAGNDFSIEIDDDDNKNIRLRKGAAR